MPSTPDYCGWGAKQGSKVRNWKNRYFVLRGRELIYYSKAKSDGSGDGLGEKGRLRVLNVDYSPDRKNGLFIHGEGKDLRMTTASAQESRVLFRKIKEAIGEQEKSFRMSPPQNQSKKPIVKEGWLLKEDSGLQTWKRSYVTLSGRTIAFSLGQHAAPKDSQRLMKVEAVKTSPLSLKLIATEGRATHVAAETRDEIEDWDRALAVAIGQPLALRQVKEVQKEVGNQVETVGDTDLVAQKYSTACEGWLEKLGQRSKIWKKRYMSLANGMLEYRKGPLEPLSAELFVADVRYSSEYADALEIEFGSDKSLTDSDIICVRAKTIRDLDKWMTALCDAIGKPRLQPIQAVSEPSSPSSSRSSEGRQNKPQLPPFPRNVSERSSSNAQPSPSNVDDSSDNQVTSTGRVKRGWLYKQGDGTSSWKLRYFVLNGNVLDHYKHVNGTAETLGSVTSVTRNHESTGSLRVQFESGTRLNVCGETKDDTEAWYAALCNASWSSAENPAERVSVSVGFSNQEEDEEQHKENGFRGWLLKKGQNFKTWKRRYFVLESSRLAYSATTDSEVLGSGVVFEVEVGNLRPFCLNIRFQNGRLLHVVAPTEEAFSKWFEVLRKASNLAESFLSQSKGEVVFDEEFDKDVGENANDVDVDFTEEDLAEYEVTLRGGASLWIAAMQNKPEYDSLSSSTSETDEEVAEMEQNSTGIIPRASEASSSSLNESQGCVGWLKKEGGKVKSWKRRYFTLYGSKLSYYKSEKGPLLRNVTVVDVVAHPSISLGLTVSTVKGRKLIIQAESKSEYEKWFSAIRGAVSDENERKSAVVEAPMMNMVAENRSSEDVKASVSHTGWMEKEGQRFKTWKRRYFTLKNSALIYYSEIGGVARGHGIVKGARPDDSKPLTLVIEFRSGKTMRVTVGSEAEMKVWGQVLSRGRSSNSRTAGVSDMIDDMVDSEEEEEDPERAARISRFNSNDYLNDTISNDTIMRLREEEGKGTLLESHNAHTSRSFKGELTFEEEEEEKEDMGVSTTGADYYRQLLAEDERVQKQRSEEKLAKGEPPITGCAPCCLVM